MHMLIYSSRKFGPLGFGKHCVLFLFLFPCEDERQEEFRTGSKGAGALCSSAGEWAILAGPPYYCYISSTPWLINQRDQLQRDSQEASFYASPDISFPLPINYPQHRKAYQQHQRMHSSLAHTVGQIMSLAALDFLIKRVGVGERTGRGEWKSSRESCVCCCQHSLLQTEIQVPLTICCLLSSSTLGPHFPIGLFCLCLIESNVWKTASVWQGEEMAHGLQICL